MNEFLEQFLIEARELSEQATGELLALEARPDDKERLDAAFRAFHTLKGGAGIVDFMAMSRAVHAAENALSAIRSGEQQISTDRIGDCLSCIDQVLQWLDEIETTGDLPSAPDAAADAIVERFLSDAEITPGEAVAAPQSVAQSPNISPAGRAILDEQLLLLAVPDDAGREGRVFSAKRTAANVLRAGLLETDAARIEHLLAGGVNDQSALSVAGAITRALGAQTAHAELTAAPRADAATRVLRVDAGRVNALVNLTGELSVAKNAIAHIAKLAEDGGNPLAPSLRAEQARLERLATDLQHAVLSLRVLPLRTVFQRFSRVVREMAVSLEKPASLITNGEDTEADKVIVEMLFEPLLHIVRNAMDHGIEPAAARAAAGKPVVATIRLSAYRQGEHVVVEVSDDGRGIDVARVRAVAAERRIAADDVLAAMSDADVTDLIFAPGFSTATTVTDLSGRGVGMDAVRTAVDRIGGRVAIESTHGQGSTVRFVLPFSIMMTRVMTVEAGGQMFGIPLDAVVETVRLPRARIQAIGEAGAFVLRNRTVPLVDLAATLGNRRTDAAPAEAIVVVTMVGGELGGLEVDRLGERFDAMLRPVEGLLSDMPGIAGTTILGDGRVLLILDLQEVLA